MTSPSNVAFGSLMSRRTDIIVTLLPDPDSPTIPSTSRRPSVKETPSTACTTPSSVLKDTLRSRTSSSGGSADVTRLRRADPRVEARVEDVGERGGDRDEDRPVDDRPHDPRQVERHERAVGEQPHARQAEPDLGDER